MLSWYVVGTLNKRFFAPQKWHLKFKTNVKAFSAKSKPIDIYNFFKKFCLKETLFVHKARTDFLSLLDEPNNVLYNVCTTPIRLRVSFIYLCIFSGVLFGSDPMKSRFTPNCIWKTENAMAIVYATNTCRVRLIQFIVVIMYAEYVKWHISTRLLMAASFWISVKSTIILGKVSKSDFYEQKIPPPPLFYCIKKVARENHSNKITV